MKLYTGNIQDSVTDFRTEGGDPSALLDSQLEALRDRLRENSLSGPERAQVLLETGRTLLRVERKDEAWEPARTAFDLYIEAQDWEGAAEACETLFLAEQVLSLAALGQGVWLAVTFPITPEVTVAMLQHVVDETPDDADGGAVAAAVAHYVADLRTEGKQRENLLFYTAQMLSSVARRHSQVETQEAFEAWMSRLELDQPDKFLVRLRNVVDVLVQDDWWIDRGAIHAKLPVN
jgi:hypothetical protein